MLGPIAGIGSMRTILYGQLEDETPFGTVRRLIGYEDYALRLLDDDGVRIAKSYGIVELTPNREYLLPTEFFEGSQTLGHAKVNDEIIDQAMALVRTLWDQGLAHRDIKPANLLVVDGRLQLIDVSGLEVRPSAWRQAVDLANMMLVMALRTDSQRVYDAALRYFSPDEVGEAFACAVGLAIPTELQRHLKEDPRDLIRGVQDARARLSEGVDPALERSADRADRRRRGRGHPGGLLVRRGDPLRHRPDGPGLTGDRLVTYPPLVTDDDDRVFKALADPTRRFLLDRLFERDGRTLTELESELEMTRFGVMKHLRVLEDADLVVTRRSGREKLHFLNPVPIRLVHDRWIDKYTERQVSALADLKHELEEGSA